MTTITIADLRDRLDEVIDQIARDGEPVAVTRDGVHVAELNPTAPITVNPPIGVAPRWNDDEIDAYLARWDLLANAVGNTWPKGVSALDAVLEQRRELSSSSTAAPESAGPSSPLRPTNSSATPARTHPLFQPVFSRSSSIQPDVFSVGRRRRPVG